VIAALDQVVPTLNLAPAAPGKIASSSLLETIPPASAPDESAIESLRWNTTKTTPIERKPKPIGLWLVGIGAALFLAFIVSTWPGLRTPDTKDDEAGAKGVVQGGPMPVAPSAPAGPPAAMSPDAAKQEEIALPSTDAPTPFLVRAPQGDIISSGATLAVAAARAPNGSTIEIQGNGPFVIPGLVLEHDDLTIRAVKGFRPVLRLDEESIKSGRPQFQTRGALRLEGLTLERVGNYQTLAEHGPPAAVNSFGGRPLHLAHCRFYLQGEGFTVHTGSSDLRVLSCEFLQPSWSAIKWEQIASKATCYVENCAFVGANCIYVSLTAATSDVFVQVDNSTMISRQPLILDFTAPEAMAKGGPISIYGNQNVYSVAPHGGILFEQRGLAAPMTGPEIVATAKRAINGWLNRSVYGVVQAVNSNELKPVGDLPTLAEWEAFWGIGRTGNTQGKVLVAGGELAARLETGGARITPEDFRLLAGSAGKGGRADGGDVGAEIDRLGPGPAYDAWRDSPQFADWPRLRPTTSGDRMVPAKQ
jgi:hypothetical protein